MTFPQGFPQNIFRGIKKRCPRNTFSAPATAAENTFFLKDPPKTRPRFSNFSPTGQCLPCGASVNAESFDCKGGARRSRFFLPDNAHFCRKMRLRRKVFICVKNVFPENKKKLNFPAENSPTGFLSEACRTGIEVRNGAPEIAPKSARFCGRNTYKNKAFGSPPGIRFVIQKSDHVFPVLSAAWMS